MTPRSIPLAQASLPLLRCLFLGLMVVADIPLPGWPPCPAWAGGRERDCRLKQVACSPGQWFSNMVLAV